MNVKMQLNKCNLYTLIHVYVIMVWDMFKALKIVVQYYEVKTVTSLRHRYMYRIDELKPDNGCLTACGYKAIISQAASCVM